MRITRFRPTALPVVLACPQLPRRRDDALRICPTVQRTRRSNQPPEEFAELEGRVRAALSETPGVVLAVSGGRDSMSLLHAAARVAPERVRVVATFDHGTGPHASAAAALVAARAAIYGLRCRSARAPAGIRPTEADWRRARCAFLRTVAAEYGGAVATAHNQDDQLETVRSGSCGMPAPAAWPDWMPTRESCRPWLGASASSWLRALRHITPSAPRRPLERLAEPSA